MSAPFNTSKLDQIMAARSAQNERERRRLLQNMMTWLNDHGSQYGIQSAYMFGSLIQPQRFHENSDIDIAVEQINPGDFFAVISLISEAMGREVDVIELGQCPFRDRIRQTGIQWTATDSSS